MADAVLEALNDKCYKLLQFSSVLAGAVAAGLKFGHGVSAVHWWLGVPSMVCFGASIALALAAKMAADCQYPMRIDRAVEMEGAPSSGAPSWPLRSTP